MPEHNPGQMGGTMRLGKRRTLFQTKNSVMSKSCLGLGLSLGGAVAPKSQDGCFFPPLVYSHSFQLHLNSQNSSVGLREVAGDAVRALGCGRLPG